MAGDDFEAAYDRMRSRGVEFVTEPRRSRTARSSSSLMWPATAGTCSGAAIVSLSDRRPVSDLAWPDGSIDGRGEPRDLDGGDDPGIFGIGWAEWGASGLSGSASTVVRIVGVVVGVVIIVRSARLRRAAGGGSGSMFTSRAYRLVVVVEVAALVTGVASLSATGRSGYVCAWVAAVVGAVVGVATTGGTDAVEATTGLIAAASLFAGSAWRLLGFSGPAASLSQP